MGGVGSIVTDRSASGGLLVGCPNVTISSCNVFKTSGVTLPLVVLSVLIADHRKRGVLKTESISLPTDPPVACAALRISLTRR